MPVFQNSIEILSVSSCFLSGDVNEPLNCLKKLALALFYHLSKIIAGKNM